MPQHYRGRGLEHLLRVASGLGTGMASPPAATWRRSLPYYTPLPSRNPPAWFSHGFHDMSDRGGGLARDNEGEYKRHLDAIVDATLDAWLSRNVANDGEKW